MRQPKFSIGQQYKTGGKNSKLCTVIDIYKTYNSKGEMVKLRYVSTHDFCGQKVTDYDVVETSVTRGQIN